MHPRRHLLPLALLLAATALAQPATVNLASLIAALQSNTESQRAQARQLLPAYGLDALDATLPLLAHENQHISRAAYHVVEQIANEAGNTPRGADPDRVAARLRAALDNANAASLKQDLLQLLTLVARDPAAIQQIARLLNDPELRERARAALEEIRTQDAALALAKALPAADRPFRIALLDALAQMPYENTRDAILAQTKDKDPALRAAAARALAPHARVQDRHIITHIVETADTASRFDAADAELRYADALAARGGNVALVLDLARHAFAHAADPAQQGAAINTLGRYGDTHTIPEILALLNDANIAELAAPALSAIQAQQGPGAARALCTAWPAVPPPLRPAYLQLLGRRGDPCALPHLQEAAQANDPVLRTAAFAALGNSGQPAALDTLIAAIENADQAEREHLRTALQTLAAHFAAANDRPNAGKAALALYRHAPDETARAAAAETLRRFPIADAADVLMKILRPDELKQLPVAALSGIIAALREANHNKKADELQNLQFQRLDSAAAVQEIIAFAHASGTTDQWRDKLGFIRKWQLLGPFPFPPNTGFQTPPFDPDRPDFNAQYGDGRRWTPIENDALPPIMDLMALTGPRDHVSAFAAATVHSDKPRDAQIRCGSDDAIRIWLNGTLVHNHLIDRGTALDADIVPIKLRPGANRLLVEIGQYAGGWNFVLRLTDPQGRPLNL